MNDDPKNIIYGKALGSLDQSENEEFNRWIKNAGNDELKEYARLLNLSALLPMSLKIKEPPLELKNKIALELYRLRDELIAVKTKSADEEEVSEERPEEPEFSEEPETTDQEDESSEDETNILKEESEEEETYQEKFQEPKSFVMPELEREEVKAKFKKVETSGTKAGQKKSPTELRNSSDESQPGQHTNYVLPNYAEREEEIKRNYLGWILTTIGFIILAAGFVYLYISLTNSIDNLKQRVNDVNRRMDELAIERAKPEPVKELLFVSDTRIVNLENLSEDGIGYGNIVYSLEKGKGVLQLAAFPEPSAGSSFHLWLYSSREYSHLAEVLPDSTGDITEEFILPEVRNSFRSRFLITEDELGTFEFKNSDLYMEGRLR